MQNRLLLLLFILFMFACAHLKDARQAYNQKDYQRTIRLCRAHIKQDSTDADALLLLSRTYLNLDSADQSLHILFRVKTLENRSKQQNTALSDQLRRHASKTNNRSEAIALLMEAESADSLNRSVLDTLATLLISQNEFQKAKERLYRLADLSQDPLSCLNRINLIENRQAFAVSEYEQGMAALKSGHKEKAENHLKKAADADPGFSEAVFQYGLLAGNRLYRKGSQDALSEAIGILRAAVHVRPDNIEAVFLLAKTLERKGQDTLGDAIEYYGRALKLAPNGKYARTCRNKIEKLEKRKAFWEKGKN